MRAIVSAIARSAADAFHTASVCVAPASTKKSAARQGWAIVSVTGKNVEEADVTDAHNLGRKSLEPTQRLTPLPCRCHCLAQACFLALVVLVPIGPTIPCRRELALGCPVGRLLLMTSSCCST